jgi:hypothetical protein
VQQNDDSCHGRDGSWKRFVLMKLISLGGAIMGPKRGKLNNLKIFSSRENRNVNSFKQTMDAKLMVKDITLSCKSRQKKTTIK